MNPCPTCGVDLNRYPHQKDIGCEGAWITFLLDVAGRIMTATDDIGSIARNSQTGWPDYASVDLRATTAVGRIKQLKTANEDYQKRFNQTLQLGSQQSGGAAGAQTQGPSTNTDIDDDDSTT